MSPPVRFTIDVQLLRAASPHRPARTPGYDGLAAGLAHLSTATRALQALVVLSDFIGAAPHRFVAHARSLK